MKTKICMRCKIEKPLSEFPPRPDRPSGVKSKCRTCAREIAKSYYYKDREKYIEHTKTYFLEHPKQLREYRREYNSRPDVKLRTRGAWTVRNAIRDGRLIKSDKCENCGSKSQLHAHHYLGYEKEHLLDVQWLCRPCHVIAHHPSSKG